MFETRMICDLSVHPSHDTVISECTPLAMQSLELSVREEGILYPLIINQHNQIIDGTTRWLIAQKLDINEVQVYIIDSDSNCNSEEFLLLTLNRSRRDNEQDLIKQATIVKRLYEIYDIKRGRKLGHGDSKDAKYIADLLKYSQRKITRLLRLLQLIPSIQDLVSQDKIGISIGNEIVSKLNEEQQHAFYNVITKLDIGNMGRQEIYTLIEQFKNDLLQPIGEVSEEELELATFDEVIRASSGEHFPLVMKSLSEIPVENIIKDIVKIYHNATFCYEEKRYPISKQNHMKLIATVETLLDYLMDKGGSVN